MQSMSGQLAGSLLIEVAWEVTVQGMTPVFFMAPDGAER